MIYRTKAQKSMPKQQQTLRCKTLLAISAERNGKRLKMVFINNSAADPVETFAFVEKCYRTQSEKGHSKLILVIMSRFCCPSHTMKLGTALICVNSLTPNTF